MEVVEIYKDYIYSINFDENDLNEYHRVFREWHDLDYLISFFTVHKQFVSTEFWLNAGIDPENPEKSAARVIDEADELEDYIKKLVANCSNGVKPDFDEYFHFLGGKYKCLWSLEPVKSYGVNKPSLLRLYAIKIESNCYLIVYGGIKLGDTIQSSPVLKEQVFQKIDVVLSYLRNNGIVDSADLK